MFELIRSYPLSSFIIAFFLGGWIGFFTTCLAVAAARGDRYIDEEQAGPCGQDRPA